MQRPSDCHSTAFNSLEIRFHRVPMLDAPLNSALRSLNALPGCLAYRLEIRPYHGYPWRITGVWESAEAKTAHYPSAELQTLLSLLLTPALAEIRFREAEADSLVNALDFQATQLAG